MNNTTLYQTNKRIVSTQEELDADINRLSKHIATCNVLSTFLPGCICVRYILDLKGKHAGDTACTDGYSVWVNPDFWNINNDHQKIGLMFHEMFHCLWLHFWRFKGADHMVANIATDIRINAFISKLSASSAFIQLPANPPGAEIITSNKFGNDSEEVIYNKLMTEHDEEEKDGNQSGDGSKDGKGSKPGTGKGSSAKWSKFKSPGGFTAPPAVPPKDGDEDEDESKSKSRTPAEALKELRDKWEGTQQSIAQVARLKGDFPGNLVEELERTRAGVDWKSILQRFILSTSATDISEDAFDRRFVGDDMFIEAIETPVVLDIVFAKDTSGSMYTDWLSQSCSEIQAAMETVKIQRLWVLDIDTDLSGLIQEYGPNDKIDFSAHGRGGTDFRPPFEWAKGGAGDPPCPTTPKAMVYFTDGYGPFPEEAPPYPVLWMTFGLDPEEYPQWPNSQVIDMRELVI